MNDHDQRLRAAITELERELAHLESSDPETRALLQDAARDIGAALQRTGTKPAEDANVVQSVGQSKGLLEEKVIEFEASHPRLSLALNRIIDVLGQFGI